MPREVTGRPSGRDPSPVSIIHGLAPLTHAHARNNAHTCDKITFNTQTFRPNPLMSSDRLENARDLDAVLRFEDMFVHSKGEHNLCWCRVPVIARVDC